MTKSSSRINRGTRICRMLMGCREVKQPKPNPKKHTIKIVFCRYANIRISVPIQRMSSNSKNNPNTLIKKIAAVIPNGRTCTVSIEVWVEFVSCIIVSLKIKLYFSKNKNTFLEKTVLLFCFILLLNFTFVQKWNL